MEKNNQLAFDISEKEFGISPIMTGKEMASVGEPDKLSMVMYLTQFYEMFKDTIPSSGKEFGACLSDLKTYVGFIKNMWVSVIFMLLLHKLTLVNNFTLQKVDFI